MGWEILFHPEFEEEFDEFPKKAQDEVFANLVVLEKHGPNLGRPYVDRVEGAEHSNMKELRCQVEGKPWRILFAFDAERRGVLLVGGDKGSDEKGFYKKAIKTADRRFQNHP